MVLRAQVMGDKGFNEKNFKLMRESMEAMKAQREAEGAAAAAGDGEDEPPGGLRKAGGELSRAGPHTPYSLGLLSHLGRPGVLADGV